MNTLEELINNLHFSSTLLSRGKAKVMDREMDAVLIRNLYGQEIVWGMFSVEKGKFKGKLANNANTEEVTYKPVDTWYVGTTGSFEMNYNHQNKTTTWVKE